MHLNAKDCEDYYCNQVGGNFFQGHAYQRGYGFFGDLRRFITPLAVRAGKYLGKELWRTGKGVLTDVAGGSSLKDSARSHLGAASKRIKADVLHRLQQQHGKGIKRKPVRKSVQCKKKRRKITTHDIFS